MRYRLLDTGPGEELPYLVLAAFAIHCNDRQVATANSREECRRHLAAYRAAHPGHAFHSVPECDPPAACR